MPAIRPALIVAIAAALAGTATAQTSPQGCYARTYTDAHLARNPDQVVRSMQLFFTPPEAGQQAGQASLRVRMADQGHAARDGLGGVTFDQGFACYASEAQWTCAIDCDGGVFRVIRDEGDSIVIRADYLTVGDREGCGGTTTLTERPGEPVDYLLRRAPPEVCPVPE